MPQESRTLVQQIQKTAAGGVLLELSKYDDWGKLQDELKKAVGDKGEVRSFVLRLKVEILDPDTLDSEADVIAAVKIDLPTISGTSNVKEFSLNQREQMQAVIEMEERDGLEKIQIGWVVCRVLQRLEVERCFQCFGHEGLSGKPWTLRSHDLPQNDLFCPGQPAAESSS